MRSTHAYFVSFVTVQKINAVKEALYCSYIWALIVVSLCSRALTGVVVRAVVLSSALPSAHMYPVSVQGVDERIMNVHYYYDYALAITQTATLWGVC